MRLQSLLFAVLAIPYAWAQTDGITVTVSRTVLLQPDEARFAVNFTTPYATSLEQAVQLLNDTGIQASDLVGQAISTSTNGIVLVPGQGPALNAVFSFVITRPADSLKSVAAKLESLSRKPPAGYSLQYSATTGPSAAAIEDARRAALTNLLGDARRKAQTMAGAAGVTLGAIRSVSDLGDSSTGSLPSIYTTSSEYRVTYSLTVRFAVQ